MKYQLSAIPRVVGLALLLMLCSAPAKSLPLLLDMLVSAIWGVDWVATNSSRAQLTVANELRLHDGYVEVESKTYDFSNADSVDLSFDVTVPFNFLGFIGAAPSPGEDLRVDFLRDDGTWEELTTFVADTGFLGILSLGSAYEYSAPLPSSAYHENFQLRFVMLGAGGFLDFLGDNWYVSNIVLDAEITPAGPNHFRMSYSSSALTCAPHSVLIEACEDAACTSLFADSVTATLAPSGWSGGDTITFSGGSTSAALIRTDPGSVTLGVASATPAPVDATTQCSMSGGAFTSSCNLTFDDSGFIVSIPEFISGRGETATIQAVKKSDTSIQCIPAFSNVNKTLNLWSEYSLPSSGTLSAYASSPSVALGQTAGSATSMTAAFNASGVASVPVNYADAGYVTVNVQYTGSGADAGLTMQGEATFLARPAGMCVQTGGECTSPPSGDYANCGVFTQAGAAFPLTVSAMAWQADGETDFCDGNTVTPNYNSDGLSINFSSTVVSPSSGANGRINLDANPAATSYIQTTGTQIVSVNESEVGVFNIGVTPPPYYGASLGKIGDTTAVTFMSQPTGRFTPDHFEVTVDNDGAIAPGCSSGNLYSGQNTSWLVAPEILISAHSVGHEITTNYTQADYLKLNPSLVFAGVNAPSTDNTTIGNDGSLLDVGMSLVAGSLSNVSGTPGVMRYVFSAADDMNYQRDSAAEVGEFNPDLTFIVDTSVSDSDGISAQSDVSITPDTSGVQVRFGRLWLEDTYGSELVDLIMPLRAEYFDGAEYIENMFEDCSAWNSTNASIDSLSAILAASGTFTDGVSGSAGILLEAPINVPGTPDEGDAIVTYAAPAWLQGDYDNNGSFENPKGTATFGVNRGHERLIYRKELR